MNEEEGKNVEWWKIKEAMHLMRVLRSRRPEKYILNGFDTEKYLAKQQPKPKVLIPYHMGTVSRNLADHRYRFDQESINSASNYDLYNIDQVIRRRKPTKIITFAVMQHYAREAGYELLR